MMIVRKGDQYSITLKIEQGNNNLDLTHVELIEFTIADLIKVWPTEVKYNEIDKEFYFPVTQEETFELPKKAEYQVRVKFDNNTVIGSPINSILVGNVLSKNIL